MISDIQYELLENLCDSTLKNSLEYCENEILKQLSFILDNHRKLLELSIDILLSSNDDSETSNVYTVKQYINKEYDRSCWKVKGSQDNEYLCLKDYCSCIHFFQQSKTIQGPHRIICKHLLAIKLAILLKKIHVEQVNNDKYIELLSTESTSTSYNNPHIKSNYHHNWKK